MLALRPLRQSATVAVTDYDFGPVTTPDRQKVVAAVLKPWLAPGVLYKRQWLSVGAGAAAVTLGERPQHVPTELLPTSPGPHAASTPAAVLPSVFSGPAV